MARHLAPEQWQWANHLRLLDRKIAEVAAGRIAKLMVMMPPRHGKSELCTHYAPVWYLSNFPREHCIMAGYGGDFAQEWGRKVRDTINANSAELAITVSADSASAGRWNIAGNNMGGMYAAGIGGSLTGRGGKLLICDDPIKNDEEARSEVYRDKLWDWWRQTFITRQEPGGGIILIMTRWHDDDLAGRLLKHEGNEWDVLRFPAIANEADILGRQQGDALWPERYDAEALASKRRTMGEMDFQALYQQEPSLEQGNLIKMDWWQWYAALPEQKPSLIVHSYDTAVKTKEVNDFSAFQSWANYPSGRYLLRCWAERMEYPELIKRMKSEYAAAAALGRAPNYIVIEDKSSGQQAVQTLKRETQLPVVARKADADKYIRLKPHIPTIETGQCYLPLPRQAPAVQSFMQELAAFPLGAHDDQVDAFSHAMGFIDEKIGRAIISWGD